MPLARPRPHLPQPLSLRTPLASAQVKGTRGASWFLPAACIDLRKTLLNAKQCGCCRWRCSATGSATGAGGRCTGWRRR